MDIIPREQKQSQLPPTWNSCPDQDQEAEELFDQIQLSEVQQEKKQNKDEDPSFRSSRKTPKKLRKQRKKEKKLKKKEKIKQKNLEERKKKAGKKREGRLKKLKKNNGESDELNPKDDDYDFSSESESFSNESQVSSDSLFANLNPTKKRVKNMSSSKKSKLERKQGFNLKELGNDGEVELNDDDSPFSQNNKKKKKKGKNIEKKQKKEMMSNSQMLQELLAKGVCVQEEDGKSSQENFDYGIDALSSIKKKKSKGPKISNKLFSDLNLVEQQAENGHQQHFQKIQFELNPKAHKSSALEKTSSFLQKSETLKKIRKMEVIANDEGFNKYLSTQAKKEVQILKNSGNLQLEGVQEVQLNVKVPKISRGFSSEQINNSMFLKKYGTKSSQNHDNILSRQKTVPEKSIKTKGKLSRYELFKSIREVVSDRKSKNITEEVIKNSFKVTNLQQLQQIRKRNQQKRMKQFQGSDQEISAEQKAHSEPQQQQKNKNDGSIIEKQFDIVIDHNQKQKPLNDEEYNQLLRLEEGVSQEDEPEIEKNQEQNSENAISQQINENQIQKIQNEEQIHEKVIEIEVEPKNISDSESNQQENKGGEINEQQNQAAAQYLKSLQEEGIVLNKRSFQTNKNKQVSIEKNVDIPQKKVEQNQEVIEARKQFRKLRKIATILKNKKKEREAGMKFAQQFYDQEAEQGSDNEDHDHEVKQINYDQQAKQYQGINLDADLQQLIDNAIDLNEEDEEEAFRKYLEDVRLKDKEELRKIMRGQFRRRGEDDAMYDQIEADEKERRQRMNKFQEYIKQKQYQEGKDLYMNQEQDAEEEQISEKQEQEAFDEMNEENLKRYLDDAMVDIKIPDQTSNIKPRKSLPQSCEKSMALSKRNTMKPKNEDTNLKIKRTSSYLNDIIMKNKKTPVTPAKIFGMRRK